MLLSRCLLPLLLSNNPPLLLNSPLRSRLSLCAPPVEECDAEAKYCTIGYGLRIVDEFIGDGEEAAEGRVVSLHYTGSLMSDSSRVLTTTRDGKPLAFRLGDGKSLLFEEASKGMRVGGKRRVLVPPSNTVPDWEALENEETGRFDCELVGLDVPGALDADRPSRRQILNGLFFASFLPYLLPDSVRPELWRSESVLRFLGIPSISEEEDQAIKNEIEADKPLTAVQRRDVLREERSLVSGEVELELYGRR